MNLNLLGRAELLGDNCQPISLPTKKVMLLLAMLAMNPDGLNRSYLVEAIWANSHHEAGRTSLRNALAALRKVLPPKSVLATDNLITLVADTVSVSKMDDEYTGEFMPGFTEIWVLDQRIQIRTDAVRQRIEMARNSDDEVALRLIEQACIIDPLDQPAAEFRVQLLERLGNSPGAAKVANSFHSRVLRELGVVVNIETPTIATETNPLTVTCDWLVEHNPEEAASFLVSTRSSWMAMSGKIALDCHQRVLDAYLIETPTRSMVSAQRLYLKWIVGEFDSCQTETKHAFSIALANQEVEAASILGTALSFGYLSQGNFREAIHHCKVIRQLAARFSSELDQVRADRHLAIIEQHLAKDGLWENRIRLASTAVEESGSPQEIAQQNLAISVVHLRDGKLDEATLCIAQARRFFEAINGRRMVGFCMLTQAMIQEEVGDYVQAMKTVDDIKAMGTDVIGHSLAAACDDITARLHGKIGDLDYSAEAVARGTILRRQFGSTASIYEINQLNPTRRLLKEQLTEQDLRAAYARAKQASAANIP